MNKKSVSEDKFNHLNSKFNNLKKKYEDLKDKYRQLKEKHQPLDISDISAFKEVDFDEIQEFWNSQPCNSINSKLDQDTIEYYEQTALKRYNREPHIKDFAGFEHWKDKEVLELGCGMGVDSLQFAKNGAKMTLVDLSDESLNLCKKAFNLYKFEANFYHGNLEELSNFLPQKKYDLIYSFGVIHHTPNPEKVIQQLSQFCHQNTEIRIMLYNRFSLKLIETMKRANIWDFSKIDRLITIQAEAKHFCPVVYTYTPNTARKLFDNTGLEVTSVVKDHIFKYDYQTFEDTGEMVVHTRFAEMDDDDFEEMQKELGWHLLIKAKPKL